MFFYFVLATSLGLGSAKEKDIYRKMTRVECAHAEHIMPSLIKGTLRNIPDGKLLMEGNNLDYPEATVAALDYSSRYSQDTLRRYPAELSEDFGEKCRSGKIKANIKFTKEFIIRSQE